MKRLITTRFGFFALASIVSFLMTTVIEQEHRWVSAGLGGLYAVLALVFLLDDVTQGMGADRHSPPHTVPSPYAPPPPPGGQQT